MAIDLMLVLVILINMIITILLLLISGKIYQIGHDNRDAKLMSIGYILIILFGVVLLMMLLI